MQNSQRADQTPFNRINDHLRVKQDHDMAEDASTTGFATNAQPSAQRDTAYSTTDL
jgi:hypothetical protein